MTELFSSTRDFQLWTYSHDGRRLLLRSTRERPDGTRIDVMFARVERMLLRPRYAGLVVTRTGSGFALGAGSFVVAGEFHWHEDGLAFDEPSAFGEFPGS